MMSQRHPFNPVKLIVGMIASEDDVLIRAECLLCEKYGPVDHRSPDFPFDMTDYYEREMGPGLRRIFISFANLIQPEVLPRIKLESNALEAEMKTGRGSENRIVNIDPGYLTSAALIMATTKDFAHRVPLQNGIYAHLELLFGKSNVRILPWTYPDFKIPRYHKFLMAVRSCYLAQLAESA